MSEDSFFQRRKKRKKYAAVALFLLSLLFIIPYTSMEITITFKEGFQLKVSAGVVCENHGNRNLRNVSVKLFLFSQNGEPLGINNTTESLLLWGFPKGKEITVKVVSTANQYQRFRVTAEVSYSFSDGIKHATYTHEAGAYMNQYFRHTL